MKESKFQKKLKDELKQRFPGCMILKNDPDQIQGIPDLTVLWESHWAVLEVKASRDASLRPNQRYYIELMDDMSFGRIIYPENMEEVLNEMERAWK